MRRLFALSCNCAGYISDLELFYVGDFMSNAPICNNTGVTNRTHNKRDGEACGDFPMQEWLLILSPLALTLYFAVNQDQFARLLGWLTQVLWW